jgi:hypothetical protein
MKPSLERHRLTLAVAVAVNIVLLAAYLWSRGGQTITVRIEARGDEFAAIVDGRERARVTAAAADSAGPIVSLRQKGDVELPSLPDPSGVRRVRVTDLSSGEVLFAWDAGDPVPADVLVESVLGRAIDLSGRAWRDYAVEVTYANPLAGGIIVRSGGAANAPGVTFGFNRLNNQTFGFLNYTSANDASENIGFENEFDRSEGVRALVTMALRAYPLALLLIAACAVIAAAGAFVPLPDVRRAIGFDAQAYAWYAAGAFALAAFVLASFVMSRYGQRMPHIVDETSYIFQAKLLASGHVYTTPPAIPEAFAFWSEPFVIDVGGRWASFYPFGHPVMLAIGARVGAIWIMPPLVGAGCAVLLFVIAKRVYGLHTALLAPLLLVTSPFFLMQASSFMSHNTAAFYLLAAIACVVMPKRNVAAWGVIAGLAFGLLFNTRPLTAVALIPAFALLLSLPLFSVVERPAAITRIAGFIAGGLLMLGAYYAYSHATTGSFDNGYQASGDLGAALGFGGSAHSVSQGLENMQLQLATFVLVMNGWPAFVGLLFVLVPFMTGTRDPFDWFLLVASVSVMAAWIIFKASGLAYGPRYWYEIMPLLLLLSARGVVRCVEIGADIAAAALPHRDGRQPYTLLGHLAVGALVVVLCALSLNGWLLGRDPSWRAYATPASAKEVRFYMDDRLIRAIDAVNPQNALVLVRDCGDYYGCYQSVFWLNDPDLKGDIVYANDLGPGNAELFVLYPCRDLYYATYDPPTVEASGSTPCP